jgi:hypothetical protein
MSGNRREPRARNCERLAVEARIRVKFTQAGAELFA